MLGAAFFLVLLRFLLSILASLHIFLVTLSSFLLLSLVLPLALPACRAPGVWVSCVYRAYGHFVVSANAVHPCRPKPAGLIHRSTS